MEMKMHVQEHRFSSSQWSIHTVAATLISICSTQNVVCDGDSAVVAIAHGLCDVIDVDMVKMGGVPTPSACLRVAET